MYVKWIIPLLAADNALGWGLWLRYKVFAPLVVVQTKYKTRKDNLYLVFDQMGVLINNSLVFMILKLKICAFF